ncbi:hypothetical protein [Priestia megaterium]
MKMKLKLFISAAILLFLVGLASHGEITKDSAEKESVANKTVHQP